MSKNLLKYFLLFMSIGMIILVAITSMKSDIFHLPQPVLKEPWFWTTLVDFYNNIAIISLWVIYKEANWLCAALWILAFICLGSIATPVYVLVQLSQLKDGEGLERVLLRR